jgi:hypothetical protein
MTVDDPLLWHASGTGHRDRQTGLAVGLLVPVGGRICQRPVVALSACTRDRRRVLCFWLGRADRRQICRSLLPAAITALKGVSDKVMYLVRDPAPLYLVTTRDTTQWPSAPVQDIRGDPMDGGTAR